MYSVDEVTGKNTGADKAPVVQEMTFNSNMVVNGLINQWTQEDQALIWNLCAKGCSTAEFKLLLYTAAKYEFDPLLKEIWCYKVTKDSEDPAIIFVSRDGLRSKVIKQGKLDGLSFKEGLENKVHFTNGEFSEKKDFYVEGTMHIKGWKHPMVHKVYYSEYCQTRWDSKTQSRVPNKMWSFETGKPVTMLKKVCEAQMYRTVADIKGMYIPEEFSEEGILENKAEYINSLETEVSEKHFAVTEEEIKTLLEAYNKAERDVYIHYKELTGEDLPKLLEDIHRGDYTMLMEQCPQVEEKTNVADMF